MPILREFAHVLRLRGDERIVDVGCGSGLDLQFLASAGHQGPLTGVDVRIDALHLSDPFAFWIVGDASAIPLRAASADVVLAVGMLWDVSDFRSAVREFRRILRQEGSLLVSAGGSLAGLEELWEAALSEVVGHTVRPAPVAYNVSLAVGVQFLRDVFGTVRTHTRLSQVRFTDARVVRAGAEQSRRRYPSIHDDGLWAEGMDVLERTVADLISRDGAIELAGEVRCLVCR